MLVTVCYYVIMLNKTQTSETLVEVGTQYSFNQPPIVPNPVIQGLGRAIETIRLETRMLVFDALHGTNYRAIRHDLVVEQKRARFEESIGIVAINRS